MVCAGPRFLLSPICWSVLVVDDDVFLFLFFCCCVRVCPCVADKFAVAPTAIGSEVAEIFCFLLFSREPERCWASPCACESTGEGEDREAPEGSEKAETEEGGHEGTGSAEAGGGGEADGVSPAGGVFFLLSCCPLCVFPAVYALFCVVWCCFGVGGAWCVRWRRSSAGGKEAGSGDRVGDTGTCSMAV